MARVETRQWPLRAAATPKELILRGAYRIDVKKARWGSRKVTLLPQEGAAAVLARELRRSAASVDSGGRRDVIKRAARPPPGG